MTKKIDYLLEDEPIVNQLFVCISFLSPEGIKNCQIRGLKIRGVYATKEDAGKRADELSKIDPDFHVFVGEVGKWLPWDPDPNDIEDQIYQEKELQDIMKGYKENLDKAKRMQEQRKRDMISNAAKEEQSKLEQRKSKYRKKHDAKKKQKRFEKLAEQSLERKEKGNADVKTQMHDEEDGDDEISEEEEKNKEKKILLTDKEKEIKSHDEKLKEKDGMAKLERERIINNEKVLKEKTEALGSVESKLQKIEDLFKKINNNK